MDAPSEVDFKSVLADELEAFNVKRAAKGATPLSIRELADHVDSSPAAVYSWLAGKRHPRPKVIERLADALSGGVAAERKRIFSALSAAKSTEEESSKQAFRQRGPAFLTAAQIADRQKFARDLWVLKWTRQFLTSQSTPLFNALLRALTKTDRPSLRWHYVFPGPDAVAEMLKADAALLELPSDLSRPTNLRAHATYHSLVQQIQSDFPDLPDDVIGKVVEGIEIKTAQDISRLGLSRLDHGYFMIEYDEAAIADVGRRFDVFQEIEAPMEGEEIYDPATGEISQRTATYWIELPQTRAVELRTLWRSVLDQIREKTR